MTVQRSERFDVGVERWFRWYLVETNLDPLQAMARATRFADAVDAGLECGATPELGGTDLEITQALPEPVRGGCASLSITFWSFTRMPAESYPRERLLEGHSRMAG